MLTKLSSQMWQTVNEESMRLNVFSQNICFSTYLGAENPKYIIKFYEKIKNTNLSYVFIGNSFVYILLFVLFFS
jgi:hypothetical protein